MRAGSSTTTQPGRRRRERLSLRRPCVPAGRICLDPRRGRRDAHLHGRLGRAGDLSGKIATHAFAPCSRRAIDRHAPGSGECAPPPRAKRPCKGGAPCSSIIVPIESCRAGCRRSSTSTASSPTRCSSAHMGEPLCYLVAESGSLNTFVHCWVYESAADREQKRAKMMQDPDWKHFLSGERQGRQCHRAEHQPDDAGAVRAQDPDAEDRALSQGGADRCEPTTARGPAAKSWSTSWRSTGCATYSACRARAIWPRSTLFTIAKSRSRSAGTRAAPP